MNYILFQIKMSSKQFISCIHFTFYDTNSLMPYELYNNFVILTRNELVVVFAIPHILRFPRHFKKNYNAEDLFFMETFLAGEASFSKTRAYHKSHRLNTQQCQICKTHWEFCTVHGLFILSMNSSYNDLIPWRRTCQPSTSPTWCIFFPYCMARSLCSFQRKNKSSALTRLS